MLYVISVLLVAIVALLIFTNSKLSRLLGLFRALDRMQDTLYTISRAVCSMDRIDRKP